MTTPKLALNYEDAEALEIIVRRACLLVPGLVFSSTALDITVVHVNTCPLKLRELMKAPDSDLIHDAVGIVNHIDRETGELKHCFYPRYAVGD